MRCHNFDFEVRANFGGLFGAYYQTTPKTLVDSLKTTFFNPPKKPKNKECSLCLYLNG